MKTTRFIIATLVLTLTAGAAHGQGLLGKIRNAVAPKTEQPANKPAQVQGITPEAMIGQCPSMPSVAMLVADTPESAEAIGELFHDRIAAINERAREVMDKVVEQGRGDADRIARQQTGRSAEQLQNMSDAETMALGDELVSRRLAESGLGGMTMADLQALEGKSDAEVMAAMSGAKAPQVAQVEDPLDNPEFRRIVDRWAEIDRVNMKEAQETVTKIHEIYARYEPQIAAVPRSDRQKDGDYHTKSEQEIIKRLSLARDTECYTLRRNAISAIQVRMKTKLSDVPRYDELRPSSGIAMPSSGYDVAGQYLNVTASVTDAPTSEIRFR